MTVSKALDQGSPSSPSARVWPHGPTARLLWVTLGGQRETWPAAPNRPAA